MTEARESEPITSHREEYPEHRIGMTLYKLGAILDGELDEIIDGLITSDQAEKMKNF